MSRQACCVVSVLASVMGVRFEQVALQLLPQLFKMVVITVQVCCRYNSRCISSPTVLERAFQG